MEEVIKDNNAAEDFRQALKENFIKYHYYMDTDDLIGNLFYTFKRNLIPAEEISFSLVNKYLDLLKDELIEKNVDIVFLKTKEENNKVFSENTMLYEILEDNSGVRLNNDVTLIQLINRYHKYIQSEVIKTILDPKVMAKTIDMYNEENIKKMVLKKKKD